MRTYSVIMAGGIGSRFWPMSTSENPKQFHDVLGTGKTLIQQTFDRLKKISQIEDIIVVTSIEYVDLVADQLPKIPTKNILAEPAKKNTAPCIALAANYIESISTDVANSAMLVAPSDHLILDETEFSRVCKLAIINLDDKHLFTLGITPSRPDTGYGYIEFNGNKEINDVIQFKEKPNKETAIKYIESGNFAWNSGIFIWSINAIKNAFKSHLPKMSDAFFENSSFDLNEVYNSCESISIDYGIFEQYKSVKIIPAEFGWSDLGTWGSLYTKINHDSDGNALIGDSIVCYNSHNNMIKSANDKKIIVTKDLNETIVVDTENALIILPKNQEQEIKTILSDLKSKGLA